MAGSGTDEALEEAGESVAPGAPSGVDVSGGGTSVWRRPTLDGHMQVVPPTMIGVFDPTSQLSKFAAQTSARRTSPVNVQRHSGNTAKAPETVSKELFRFVAVREADRERISNRTFNTVDVLESPTRTLTRDSQTLEANNATESKIYSPYSKLSKLSVAETTEICEVEQPPAEDGCGHTSSTSSSASSSSSASTDDDEQEKDNAECARVDDEEADVSAEVWSAAVDRERRLAATTPKSTGTRSSADIFSPAAIDVVERRSEQAATSDERSATATSLQTPSGCDNNATGVHFAVSPLPLPVSATSPSVNEADNRASGDVDLDQAPDEINEFSSSSSSSCSSPSCSCHDEQDGDFVKEPELRISVTDHGTCT